MFQQQRHGRSLSGGGQQPSSGQSDMDRRTKRSQQRKPGPADLPRALTEMKDALKQLQQEQKKSSGPRRTPTLRSSKNEPSLEPPTMVQYDAAVKHGSVPGVSAKRGSALGAAPAIKRQPPVAQKATGAAVIKIGKDKKEVPYKEKQTGAGATSPAQKHQKRQGSKLQKNSKSSVTTSSSSKASSSGQGSAAGSLPKGFKRGKRGQWKKVVKRAIVQRRIHKRLNRKLKRKAVKISDAHESIGIASLEKKSSSSSRRSLPRQMAEILFRRKPKGAEFRGRPALDVKMPFILRALGNKNFLAGYEVLLCLLTYALFIETTYVHFFLFENHFLGLSSVAIDLIILVDYFIRLMIEFWRHVRALNYVLFLIPSTFKFWMVGFFAGFPLNYILALIPTDSIGTLEWIEALKFNRFIGLGRIFYVTDVLDHENYLNEYSAFMIKFFTLFTGLAHLTACAFYRLAGTSAADHMLGRSAGKIELSWLQDAHENKMGIVINPFHDYLVSLQLSISMLSTTGYGDLAPKRDLEIFLALVVMLVGAIGIGGYFTSIFTGSLLAKDGARYQLFLRLSLIEGYLSHIGSSALLTSKTREYYECLWNYREGVFRVESIRHLPPCMYEDILFDICYEMLQKSYLFRNLDEPFLRDLSKTVQVYLYNPEMIICEQGEPSSALYFIIQGECLVKSPSSINTVSAILRPGCIFGESNLLFSTPHTANIETRTCSQFLVIHKDALLNVCHEHPHSLGVMRARLQRRLSRLQHEFELQGAPPILWVKRTKGQGHGRLSIHQVFTDNPITFRWASGFSRKVPEADADIAAEAVIVDMPPVDPRHQKAVETYENCVCPVTLLNPNPWLRLWHGMVQLVAVLWIPFLSIRHSFSLTRTLDYYWIRIADMFFDPIISLLFAVDVVVQILTAVPSSGLYYKCRDGWKVLRGKLAFYIDILSAIPISLASQNLEQNSWGTTLVLFLLLARFAKLGRANTYSNYLDERYPFQLFWLRLVRSILAILINVACFAAFLNWFTCPPPGSSGRQQCEPVSWLGTPYSAHELQNENAFLYSFYFSVATFTSSGFGDFAPESQTDLLLIISCQCWSTFLTAYFTSKLTSALAASSVAKIRFEEKVISVRRFFEINGITMRLRDRIIEHYKLRHQFNRGVILPLGVRHLMFDAPPYIGDDSLFAELNVYLDGVPVFAHADPTSLITIGKLIERYILPPNITFVRRGDVRRHLYIIRKGSVAIMREDTNEVKGVLTETGHFGLRDLLYGEPSFNDVRTLSYCYILVIDAASFNLVFDGDDDLQEVLQENRAKLEERIRALNFVYQSAGREWEKKERKPTGIPSWITFPTKENPENELCSYEEFTNAYKKSWFGQLCRHLLMRRTVHPAGTFALVWLLLLAFGSILDLLILMFELLPQFLSQYFIYVILPVKLLFAVNAYVQLHWAFYTPEAQKLVCHPVQTAMHCLLDHRFIFTFLFDLVPYAGVFVLLGSVNLKLFGDGFRWSLRMQFQRLFHLPRLGIMFQFGRNAPRYRSIVLSLIYVILTLAVGTCFACIALYLACPWDASAWDDSVPGKVPACLIDAWLGQIPSLAAQMSFGLPRWILAVYYIFQALFAVGYGDVVATDPQQIQLLIFVMIFGYISLRVIQADITASSDTGDETRLEYLEKMKRLQAVMKRQRVDPALSRKINENLEHTWLLSKGLQPHELMKELHPALQTDLFREYIGDALSKVPLLADIDDSTIRTLCAYLNKLHFIRGTPITRRGNLEFEMYIIVDGFVRIAGENTEYLCLLGPGETIGETQMMYGMVRRYTAVAATNVEALALDAVSFSDMLDHYPNLLHRFESRMNFTRADLFERKISLMDGVRAKMGYVAYSEALRRVSNSMRGINHYEAILHGEDVDERSHAYLAEQSHRKASGLSRTMRRRNSALDFLRAWNKNVGKFILRNVFNWGEDDVGMPFIYLACEAGSNRRSWLLHPRCGFLKHFSTLVLMVSWLSPALALYLLVFAEYNFVSARESLQVTVAVSFVSESVYFLHVVLQFFTAFMTIEGNYCKEHRRVVFRYVSSITRFWFDLISLLPVEFIPDAFLTGSNYKYMNLVRLLRLVHYYRTLYEGYEKITVTAFQYHFVTSVSTFCLMFHLLACLIYGISPCLTLDQCQEDTWTFFYVLNLPHEDETELAAWKWYLRSVYWVAVTITTTGFGDIRLMSLTEVVASIICIFCGAFLLAILLSEFTHGVTSLTRFKREYLYQLKIDANYLESLGLSRRYRETFFGWFLLRWEFSRGVSFREAVDILPLTLRKYVNLALYGRILAKVPLFQGLQPRFFLTLASYVEHSFFLPGQVIVNLGDNGNTLFIVAKGRVSGYEYMRSGHPRLLRWYGKGCVFGRLPTLFYDQTYTKSYRAELETEVLTLSKHSVFYLARYFQDFAARLQAYIHHCYDPSLGIDTIFTDEPLPLYETAVPARESVDKGTSAMTFRKNVRAEKKRKKGGRVPKQQRRSHPQVISLEKQKLAEEAMETKMKEVVEAWQIVQQKTSKKKKSGGTEQKTG